MRTNQYSMNNLNVSPEQDIPNILPPEYTPKKNSFSKIKIIFIFFILILIMTVSGFLYLHKSPFFNSSATLARIQGGRDANYWELSYTAMSTYVSYSDICNKIYPKAYVITGGGFSGKPLGTLNLYEKCLSHAPMVSSSLSGFAMAINPLEYMGYSKDEVAESERSDDFLKKIINTDDFRYRLGRLPDFSKAEDDTQLLASSLQCSKYSTSYVDGLPGHIPSAYEAEHHPCCTDLNEDKICDQIQPQPANVSIDKIGLSLLLKGVGIVSQYSNEKWFSNYPLNYTHAGYLIKDKPFSLQVILKNNDTVPINPTYTYLMLWTTTDQNDTEPIDLSKYQRVSLSPLQPGESATLNFDNLSYNLNEDRYTMHLLASLCIGSSDGNRCGVFPETPGVFLMGFSSENALLEYKKEWLK